MLGPCEVVTDLLDHLCWCLCRRLCRRLWKTRLDPGLVHAHLLETLLETLRESQLFLLGPYLCACRKIRNEEKDKKEKEKNVNFIVSKKKKFKSRDQEPPGKINLYLIAHPCAMTRSFSAHKPHTFWQGQTAWSRNFANHQEAHHRGALDSHKNQRLIKPATHAHISPLPPPPLGLPLNMAIDTEEFLHLARPIAPSMPGFNSNISPMTVNLQPQVSKLPIHHPHSRR